MCGRFSQAQIAELDREVLRLLEFPPPEPRYNVAPSQDAAIIRARTDANRVDSLRWGLIPSWARDPKIGYRTINARAETLAAKPAFRDNFADRRCAIPIDGFYEWKKTTQGKLPYFIRRRDGRPMLLAGLWDTWFDRAQGPVETFTIVTTQPNAALRVIHDRMPVVLSESDLLAWLDPSVHDTDGLRRLLVPCPDPDLEVYRVSTYVNAPANEGPECIAPTEGS